MSMNAIPNVAGGGEPPYDADMDRRLTVLETRIDTIVPTLATKNDIDVVRVEIEKLRSELFKAFNDAMLRMMALVIALFVGAMGVNITMVNSLRTLIAASQPVAARVEAAPALLNLPKAVPHPNSTLR
jgi:hypothetical protein